IEELQRLRLRECAANDDGAQLAAKRLMNLLQQSAAQSEPRSIFRQRFVHPNQCIESPTLAGRQSVKSRLEARLQIFQYQRHETEIGNFVLRKSPPHIFRP